MREKNLLQQLKVIFTRARTKQEPGQNIESRALNINTPGEGMKRTFNNMLTKPHQSRLSQ